MGFRRELRRVAEYEVVRFTSLLLLLLPGRGKRRLGLLIGRMVYRLDRRHRSTAVKNLEAAYPEEGKGFRDGIAKGAYEHLGRLLVEILMQRPDVRRILPKTKIEGWAYLQKAAGGKKGYFLVSGHFGNWERIAHLQGALGYPLWMVTRPLDNPRLEAYFARLRECTGNSVIHKRNAVRAIVKGLKAGKGIAFVIDQNFGEDGRLFVPFFGRPAATTPTLGVLATRMGVPVLPVFAYPGKDGRYRIVYGPPLEPTTGSDHELAALELTAQATGRLEEAVRAEPGAWFWMHRRWRTRPEEE